MGSLNPGNSGFSRVLDGEYIDKTGLISLINHSIESSKFLTCISRPRRFGKTYAAQMLCAYYDRSCDSSALFSSLKISSDPSYKKHLNAYNVIYLDMTGIKPYTELYRDVTPYLIKTISEEIAENYPEVKVKDNLSLTLENVVAYTGKKFVIIIDEWDAPIRENPSVHKDYLDFLRSLFKNSLSTAKIFAAAYITGILPIKKDGSESAISDFDEHTMLAPGAFAEYVGFTEAEVISECSKYNRNFDLMKKWYDGYSVGDNHSIYNPYSVMLALDSGKFKSYWKKTSAAETLMSYIDLDLDGLQDDIAKLIAGERISVDTGSFKNDVISFTSKDDVLTLLVHLGYLFYEEVPDSYDGEADDYSCYVMIPNDEIRSEFDQILRKSGHRTLVELVKKSDRLLEDTLNGDNDAVAKAIQDVHDTNYAPNFYNNEQSLRYVVKMAYISCVDQYSKVEELPSGRGIADIAYIPKRSSPLPAMIIELKWNQSSEGAIGQIKEKNYPSVLENYGGDIVLVGISYDEKTKVHCCRIEKIYK